MKRVLLTELGSPGGNALGRHRAGEGLDWLLGRCDSLSFPTTCCLFDLIPPSLLTDLHEAFLPYMDPQHHLLGLPYSPLSLQESTSNIRSAYICDHQIPPFHQISLSPLDSDIKSGRGLNQNSSLNQNFFPGFDLPGLKRSSRIKT